MADPPIHPDSNLPASVGPFRIVRALGGGGMGEVYLGERAELFSQRVAIKVLHSVGSTGEMSQAMREGDVLVSLDHPNIVRLLDRGVSESGLRYLVMEYVEGVAIDVFCDERRLSVRERILLLMQVMDAVAFAHRHLIVHSDLKPSNILVTSAGEAKLLDFGVATLLRNASERTIDTLVSTSYTPLFASPEQRDGGRVTVASDVYSLGVVAQVLLTGINPGSLQYPSSGDLDAVLRKAMQTEPEDRYPGVDAFRADLQGYLDGRPVTARAADRVDRLGKWIRRHRLAAAMSALFVCAVVLSSAGVVWKTAQAARQRRIAQNRLHDLVRLTGTLEGELYDSVDPLANSEGAKSSLLRGATETLDTLATDDSGDGVLSLELAQQYGKLAQLEFARSVANPRMRMQALSDVAKGVALMKRISTSDRAYDAAQRQMGELVALQRTMSAT
jgi:serine/threonine protein kinase